ncbi:UNKNOWN [Stylonychia lemnae]|uniref:Transmembrane protein n=1 Tax=Stylonychia lemnae TaxID=5949 RepID=A0A078AUB5_STYLE|nr:UNKNOWN [Stylonychia lemnae]|eukprot:CDW85995.1 UNKNOWN [Stylonychia lemnae]
MSSIKQPLITKKLTDEEQKIESYFNFEESACPSLVSDENLSLIRFILLIPSIATFIGSIFVQSFVDTFFYFTCWGMHIVNIAIVLSIMAKSDMYRNNINFKRIAGIFNEIAFISQFAIVAIYWPVLHEESLKIVEKHQAQNPEWAWKFHQLMIYIHIVPAISIFLNVLVSKLVFFYEHSKMMVIYSITYFFVNFVATKLRGSPVYPFLPWEDWFSLVVCLIIMIPNILVYYIVCGIVRYFRVPHMQLKRD